MNHSQPVPTPAPSLLPLLARLNNFPAEIREGVEKAIRSADEDPQAACMRARKMLDLVLRGIFDRRIQEPAGTRPLDNILQRLHKDGFIPDSINVRAHAVIAWGNLAVHKIDEQISASDVRDSLHHLVEILDWYVADERPHTEVVKASRLTPAPAVSCPACGSQFPAGAKSCPDCGWLPKSKTELAPVESPVNLCTNPACNAANPPGERNCVRCGCALSAASGTLLHGRYRLDKFLKAGGFGAIYRAFDTHNHDRVVVVKEMIVADPKEFKIRLNFFVREFEILRLLNDKRIPSVPKYYGFYQDEEKQTAHLVIEFLPGRNLLEILEANGDRPFALAQVVEWGKTMCDVLAAMHAQRPPCLHRDVKPDNIMLLQDGRTIKMIDFGTARELKDTSPVTRVFSEDYAPPEQVLGKPEPRSDLFALAATLFHLATGKVPAGAQTAQATLLRSDSGIRAEDRWFFELLKINLAVRVNERYPSVSAFKEDLEKKRVRGLTELYPAGRPSPEKRPSPPPLPPREPAIDRPNSPPPLPYKLVPADQQPTGGKPHTIVWTEPASRGAPWVIALMVLVLLIGIGGFIFAGIHNDWFQSKSTLFTTRIGAPATTQGKPPVLTSKKQPPTTKKDTPKPKNELPKSDKNSIGVDLVLIPKGSFEMGSPPGEKGRGPDEEQHPVVISRAFYMGKNPVTVGQFRAFVSATNYKTQAEQDGGATGYTGEGNLPFKRHARFSWKNPGFPQDDSHPVVNVTWNDAKVFCQWLSQEEGKTYRLPTEAEWEYACRAGTTTRFYCGDQEQELASVANLADRALKQYWKRADTYDWDDGWAFTAPVGGFVPNKFGLYHMHGNVWQWCGDWYSPRYYALSPPADPQGPLNGKLRVARGGSFLNKAVSCRSASRTPNDPSLTFPDFGFRVVRVVPPGAP